MIERGSSEGPGAALAHAYHRVLNAAPLARPDHGREPDRLRTGPEHEHEHEREPGHRRAPSVPSADVPPS
ncbi:hypothetical protein BRD22_06440 [Halobacteriales archaeon SW_8_68_21]|nr:MAG: hypothetical protein BRD22_06440 [Halobacteriales archaeon SW_8_68_21]